MRSYTNKDGQVIEVSEEHLKTAIEIKKELQKNNGRANWNQLVRMMKEEGFDDAEQSESYRCMIKAYQKSIGELPDAPKYADMVADSKLISIRRLVGDISYEKRENQHYLRQINKGKRELIDFALVLEEISNAIREYDFTATKLEYADIEIKESSSKKMVVQLSDFHIGSLVDLDVNKFDFNIAVARISKFANSIINRAIDEDITDIYIMNTGDVIEHSTMRYAHAYDAEFPFSEQIVRASDLIIKLLMFLAKQGFNITYAGIAGNHDRITDKDKNIDGDHAVRAINYAIKTFIDNTGINNIKFDMAKDYHHSFEVNGMKFLAIHGDLDSKNDVNLVAKLSHLYDEGYDVIIMGHYHNVQVHSVGDNKWLFVGGSLKGSDNYSINKLRKISPPSQSYYVIDEDGEIEVKWVNLHIKKG